MIPDFTPEGNLPPGLHRATWEEVEARFGGTARRRELLRGLRRALEALQVAGCRTAYLDGSFVTTKPDPEDWDGCSELAGVDLDRLDPVLLTFDDRRQAQKAKYGGELFLARARADAAGTRFIDYFQRDKHSLRPKGILLLDLRSRP